MPRHARLCSLGSGVVFAFRAEADPRDAARVRPWMSEQERRDLYRALEEESGVAQRIYGGTA